MRYQPLFLIIGALAVLFVVAGCRGTNQAISTSQPNTASATAKVTPVKIGADEAACPVLGVIMKKADMIPIQHGGKTYYMCCQDCIAKFKADPEKYIQHPASPNRGSMEDNMRH